MEINGNDLVRKLNEVVTKAIEEWAVEQTIRIKYDGALVTITERPDVPCGLILTIKYPFTYND